MVQLPFFFWVGRSVGVFWPVIGMECSIELPVTTVYFLVGRNRGLLFGQISGAQFRARVKSDRDSVNSYGTRSHTPPRHLAIHSGGIDTRDRCHLSAVPGAVEKEVASQLQVFPSRVKVATDGMVLACGRKCSASEQLCGWDSAWFLQSRALGSRETACFRMRHRAGSRKGGRCAGLDRAWSNAKVVSDIVCEVDRT